MAQLKTSSNVNFFTKKRLASIDIFRGLTMFVMIFVNDVASVKNLPYWTYHIADGVNGFTYVDMVFPTFLFIVGLSIPIAIKNRLQKRHSKAKIIWHIIIRTLALLFVGVLIINGRAMDAETTGISYMLWNVLMLLAVFAIWNVYSKKDGQIRIHHKILKWLGVIVLGILIIIFRRKIGEDVVWIKTEWWGILGLIGWSYLGASLYYMFSNTTKYKLLKLNVIFIVLIVVSVLVQEELLTFSGITDNLINCVLGPVTLAGVIVSNIVVTDKKTNTWKKIGRASLFTLCLFVLGRILSFYGINGGNPSWSLYSSGIATVLFLLFYIIADVYKQKKWAGFLKPMGENTLLAYLIPDVFYAIFGVVYISNPVFQEGTMGVIRAILFSFLMLGITWGCTKLNIRLKL